DVMRWIGGEQELNFLPGMRFQYSNTGYTVLAEIIATITGMPFARYAKQMLFDKLGMVDTLFVDSPDQLIPRRALGYVPNNAAVSGYSLRNPRYGVVGSTSLQTTLADMQRWATALADNGSLPSNLLIKFGDRGVLDDGKQIPYGFGQIGLTYGHREILFHGGVDYGFNAAFARTRDGLFSVFAATNGSFAELEELILSIIKQNISDVDPPQAVAAVAALQPKQVARASAREGVFASADLSDVRRILKKEKGYYLDWMQGFDLVPSEEGSYSIIGATGWLSFKDEDAGYSLILQTPDTSLRIPEAPRVRTCPVEAYIGCYVNKELGSLVQIYLDSGEVFLKIANLEPEAADVVKDDLLVWRGYWDIANLDGNVVGSIDICHPRCLRVRFWKIS